MQKRRIDYWLVILVVFLVAAGLVILYSTSAYNGRVRFHDPAYYFKKQMFVSCLGLVVMFLISRVDYHMLLSVSVWIYLISVVLSTLVLFIGDEYNGSKRWLSLGPFSFQPAEFAKVAVILFLSQAIVRCKKQRGILFMIRIFLLALPLVALVGSNNLSTAIIILGIACLLIFVASPYYGQFAGLIAAGGLFMGIFLAMESYRLERLAIWRDPEAYEKGFQTLQGLLAIGSGGIFGVGFGSSMQKLGFVPEAQNDMIFSIICEEFGLVGAVLLLLIFSLLLCRLGKIAMSAEDLEGVLAAAGILGHIALQVLLNVAVVTNSIPNTGITLPFVSYGGTSIVFLLAEMGIALSVSRGCEAIFK